MAASAIGSFVTTLHGWLASLGLPVGGIVLGFVVGILVYEAVQWLRHRPSTTGAGTVPIRLAGWADDTESVDHPVGPAAGLRDAVPVQVYGSRGQRTVMMEGPGKHPSMPLPRARRFLVVFVVTFAAAAVVLLLLYSFLFSRYDHLVAVVGEFLYWPLPWPGVYAASASALTVPDYIFPMYLAGMLAFATGTGLIYARTPFPRGRRLAALALVVGYVGVMLVIDSLFFTVPGETLRNFALIVRAFTGGLFLGLLSLCGVYLPKPQRIRPRFRRDRAAIRTFFAVALLSLALATTALLLVTDALHLNGLDLGFTVLLLLPLLTLETFTAISRVLYFRQVRRRALPPVSVYHPSVSIIVPAYNEEEWIAEALHAADVAAAKYPGTVEVIVGNDGSTDRTLELARAAVAKMTAARGLVVDLPHGGKSNGLNGALALARGEIVIRCDGDTFISEETGFSALIPHFADPTVGGVQGAIHPRQRNRWTRKLRALEIAWNHYLLRPGMMGTRTAEVIDGLFSAFRRSDLVKLGGYVPWNGEDTEIAIRIQRLGYKLRIEPKAVALEDVPENYDSLRRQRVRWARGILMANGQHYPALLGDTPEFGGLAVLFWFLMYIRSGVRSLVYLFLVLLIVILGVPALIFTAALFAIAILLRAVPLGYFLTRMHRADVLPWIPFFPFANAIKQTFRFEAYGLLGKNAVQEYV